MLARADWVPASTGVVDGYESMATHVMGATELDAQDDIPVAAVTRLLDCGAEAAGGWWLRADPVHLAVGHDRLILMHGASLQLELAHARQLVQDILAVFSADGWRLEAVHPYRWYLQLPTPPAIQTTPLSRVIGRDIYSFLPSGPQGKAWHAVLNEVQTVLHGSSANLAREAAGLPSINSLWLWGGGWLPKIKVRPAWRKVWTNDPYVAGLAELSGIAHQELPRDARDWLRMAGHGDHLLVLNDETLLHDRWERLEQAWFQPLLTAVRHGKLAHLDLLDNNGGQARLTPGRARCRFWRRHGPAAFSL